MILIHGIPKPSLSTATHHLRSDAGVADHRDRAAVLRSVPGGSGGGDEGDDPRRQLRGHRRQRQRGLQSQGVSHDPP